MTAPCSNDGCSPRMMPTEEPTLPPRVVVRQYHWEDGRSFTEVRRGTEAYRVDGDYVPSVTIDPKTGRLLISGRPGTYQPRGHISKVLKGPDRGGSGHCIECGRGQDMSGGAFVLGSFLGSLLGVTLGRWSKG